jgi:natural product biosynthesis luciferase-like monooxygenase protein
VRQIDVVGSGAGGAVRCALVGDEPLVVQCADIAASQGLEVVVVATANPVVRDEAEARGIPVVGPGAELSAGLDAHPADVLLSIANLRMISSDVLGRVQLGINYHDGPLPGYAGLNVTSWALLAGEPEHAISWHVMTTEPDGGELIAVERFAVEDDENAFSLNARAYEAALTTFPRIAGDLASGRISTSPQPDGTRRMFMRHDRPAVVLDPTAPAADTARAVRALDLGHRLRNGLGVVRWVVGDQAYVVDAATTTAATPNAAPGTLVAVDEHGVRVATPGADLVVSSMSSPEGARVDIPATFAEIPPGTVLASSPALRAALAEREPAMSRDELFWIDRLCDVPPAAPRAVRDDGHWSRARLDVPDGAGAQAVVAALAVWLARSTNAVSVSFGLTDERQREVLAATAPLTRSGTAMIQIAEDAAFAAVVEQATDELDRIASRQPLLRDALGRDPRTRGHEIPTPVLVEIGAGAGVGPCPEGVAMRVAIDREVVIDAGVEDVDGLDRIAEQLTTLLTAGWADAGAVADELPIIGPTELTLLDALNDTYVEHDRTATLDGLFRAQVARTPDAPALSFGGRTLSYAELDAAVGTLAGRLAAVGVGQRARVGIAVPRSVEMVVGVLATLELGAAYVPLDPSYPEERLEFMVGDAGLAALLGSGRVAAALAGPGVSLVDPAAVGAPEISRPAGASHDATDLAYVIYTSGSTGLPKGVMLEHRQVVNFFAAMDVVLAPSEPGTWLAVTSLSFDISVLELLWTLTRGFHVVLKADSGIPVARTAAVTPAGPVRPVSFSLFYFAAGEETAADGYRLLLESAHFADRHGFEAVWTPERHFHAFGGAYPNPSVIGAALAATTTKVAVRAGSVVLPLHSPIRVAEEWAVVDNLSRGRVGISFAAGWQPDDFVLNPGAYATAKADLADNIAMVQRLWRGETVAAPGHDGTPVAVRTLPRPVQPELPVWLTSAGTPATFERAGTLGVNVLTHLLGQSIEQLRVNIARYRAAWSDAGHPGEGRVTLMMHTFLDTDADNARTIAREPMKSYLGTAVGLLRDVASAFPTFANRGAGADDLFASLTNEELDQLLEVAADRYLGTSGLFGTSDEAAAMVEAVAAAGVDEVACLIDFGIDTDAVLASLDLLLAAKATVDEGRAAAVARDGDGGPEESVASLVARYGVSHLQCTPSLAAMLVADPADRAALRRVGHLMLGGEALPAALASELRALLPGRFTNMYGPTETTIWSLTHEIAEPPGSTMPIGTAVANTTVFVLDAHGRRLPVGALGELHIGGEGVARGYHNRPELTAERFVDRPGMGRVYATGDLTWIHPAGHVEFGGRTDNQVKIRGHRIELGEIESVIDRHPDVVQAVVVARTETGDPRLVAYVVARAGTTISADAIRAHVASALPDAMVPSGVVQLDAFPLTPNGKIDRKRLPEEVREAAPTALVAALDDAVERLVAETWMTELERAVGRDDNFFDIGGHSLLAVKVFRRLSEVTGAPLALTDVFRFPTVRTCAAHITALLGAAAGDGATAAPSVPSGTDRGARRRQALTRRGGH